MWGFASITYLDARALILQVLVSVSPSYKPVCSYSDIMGTAAGFTRSWPCAQSMSRLKRMREIPRGSPHILLVRYNHKW